MKARAHVYVSGLVQGVFFRSSTKRMADRLGVKGWVRNLQDGRVEAVFEGDREAVASMIEWCHRGPPDAIVEKVDVVWEDYRGEFKDFKILY
ncbi:MAG: acylphosphatase [Candidatus Terraquivivens tikiterensis]|uniref:Acylphosphatase n=1 Tax=Candidatus Terraquivivens tikiterensis TaxID=1980982 RepID=A0A2R7Y144_9ARCH|nr:MAG: acylphosphatase [Candidatus Terraquivivens tikiterensis]